VSRVEDPRFLTGTGRYLGNLEPRDALVLVPVRAGIPHGVLNGVDTAAARTQPGVIDVCTAGDLDLNPIPTGTRLAPPECARPPLATDRVRFAGEIVAVVVAETAAAGWDAADLVWPDIDPLPAVASIAAATAGGAPLLFPELGTNVVHESPGSATGDVLREADVVVEAAFVNQRLAAVPLEANGALAVPRPGGLDLWVGSQNVFGHQRNVSRVLDVDPDTLRVIVPDMGGGFGAKFYAYPEQLLTAAIAVRLGRPVRWHETRRENLGGMYQGRAQRQEVAIGADHSGRIIGLRATIHQDVGAYPAFGTWLPTLTQLMASGVYAIEHIDVGFRCVATNTTPIHAYRGAGRPEAASLIERAVDLVAAELTMDPAEIRRRNFIPDDAFPYRTATGATYDSGAYETSLDKALEVAGYETLRREQAERRTRGDRVQLGIGLSTYVEVTAVNGDREWSAVDIDEEGFATIRVGTSGHGQGHETAFAQLLSGLLGMPMDRVRVIQGDTAEVLRGAGTGGSRSLQIGGSSVLRSGELVLAKAKRLVARHHEAHHEDVVVVPGGLAVAGAPGTELSWAQIAAIAHDPDRIPEGEDTGLGAETEFDQEDGSFPFGAHVSVVEVDTETGAVGVRRHVAVDDCGRILNPLLVDGQIHGGIAQGVGQALIERVAHDEDANPLSGTLMSYLIPTAGMLPSFELEHTTTPSPLNPLGVKGIGEAGTIGATPAVQNAVVDALAPFGVRHVDMPATAERVWRAITQAATTS
jgi:carbon-monoxide dehydrogenase large subunit